MSVCVSRSQPDNDPIRTGYLVKRGAIQKSWKRRFFVVRPNYFVEYYENEDKFKAGVRHDVFDCSNFLDRESILYHVALSHGQCAFMSLLL